jgi:glycosyltransferase involved in cell wall biosynthesis
MHVLYVIKRFPKVSETFILQEIQELERQGDWVSVCSLRTPFPTEPRHPGADELAARTLYLPAGPFRRIRLITATLLGLVRAPGQAWAALAWAVRWAVQDRHPRHLKRFGEACWLRTRIPPAADHIHAHFGHAPATVALLLGRFTGKPFSFTGHANDVFVKPCRGLLRAKIAEASFVAAVAEPGRRYLAETAAPGDRGKIVVVRNGVDRRRFTRRSSEPGGWVPLVLCVARLVEIKGLDTLIEACALLARRRVRFRCEIVGEGRQRESLEHLTEELGQNRHLKLVGNRDHEGVRAALDRASVFVLPSRVTESGRRDGLPCVIVEAMAVGVPVVTTPVSGIPDVVRHGESGLLVPPGNPNALAGAIERVLSDHGLRVRLVRGGWRTADEFDLEAWVARRRTLFEETRAA